MKRFVLLVLLTLFIAGASAHAAGPIQVLLIDGQAAGPYHQWKLTTPVLKKELEEAGIFQVTVATAPESPNGDFSSFHPDFAKYQVVISNLDSPDWPADLKAQFEKYVSNGGGFVVVHAADNSFAEWKAYNEMTGIGGWRKRNEAAGPLWYYQDGKLVSDPSPGNAGLHGLRLPFRVDARVPEHPILKGLPSSWMHYADELYGKLRGPGGPNMTVIATAHSEEWNKGTGHDEPMLVVLKYGKGRVFHTIMGHDVAAIACVGFMTTFQRGTEWAATGKVTQKIPTLFPTANTVVWRSDLAAMDPAYKNGVNGPMPAPRPAPPASK